MKYLVSILCFLTGVGSGLIIQHNIQIHNRRLEAKANPGYWKIPDSPLPIAGAAGSIFKTLNLKIESDFPLVEVVYGSSGALFASENEAYDLFPYRREVLNEKFTYRKADAKPVIENC